MKDSIAWAISNSKCILTFTIRDTRRDCLRSFEESWQGEKWKNLSRRYPHLNIIKVRVFLKEKT